MVTRGDVAEAVDLRAALVAAAERKRLKQVEQEQRFLRRKARRRALLRAAVHKVGRRL